MQLTEFEHIIRTLRAKLVDSARYYLSDEDEAEDVVQEASVKLWLLRERLDKEKFQTFALTVTRNLAIDRLRRRKTHQLERLDVYEHSDGTIECDRPCESADAQRQLEEKEEAEWLRTTIGRLPDKYRAILRMKQVDISVTPWTLSEWTMASLQNEAQ